MKRRRNMAEFVASKYNSPTLEQRRSYNGVTLDRLGNAFTRKVVAYHESGTTLEWAYSTESGLQAVRVEPSQEPRTVKVLLEQAPFKVVQRAVDHGWTDKEALGKLRARVAREWGKFKRSVDYFHLERLPGGEDDSIIGPGGVGVRDGVVQIMIADNRWSVPVLRGTASFPSDSSANARDITAMVDSSYYGYGHESPSDKASCWTSGRGGRTLRRRLGASILAVVMDKYTSLDAMGVVLGTASYGREPCYLIYKYGTVRAKELKIDSYRNGALSCLEGGTCNPAEAAAQGVFVPAAHLPLEEKVDAMRLVESLRIAGSM